MALEKTYIPYGAYFSTPFCRWQGPLAEQHSIKLAAGTTKRFLAARNIPIEVFDAIGLGITVHQRQGFYGAPWLGALIGAPAITGPTISQACATSARVVAAAALEIESGQRECYLTVACDRTSNGPHIYYPNPKGPGALGESENPVFDNFSQDPYGKVAMVQTAENVASAEGITTEEQNDLTLLRYQQYQDALADDRAFQKRYMIGAELPGRKGEVKVIEADDGIFPTTAEGLARLRPVLPEGTVTYGTQTFPADGNAGVVLCNREHAQKLSRDKAITIQLLAFDEARVKKAMMPMAPVPAALAALKRADLRLQDCKAIKTHNPFAVNDVYFCRKTGVSPNQMNHYGSPLIWGHPQAPTGMRALAELIEELVISGGGIGLFSGCAAGDTAMALVIRVD